MEIMDYFELRGGYLGPRAGQENIDLSAPFRLRHYNSGLLLSVVETVEDRNASSMKRKTPTMTEGGKKICLALVAEPGATEKGRHEAYVNDTLFQMEFTQKISESHIRNNIVTKLRHLKSGLYLTTDQMQDDLVRKKTNNADLDLDTVEKTLGDK